MVRNGSRAHARSAGGDWLRQNLARVRQRDTGRLARKRRARPAQGPQEGKLEMLTQPQVQRYSAECGLRDLMIAEKEVVLTFLLQLLSERGILDRLAFKGGTCLRKMFIGSQGRFSTDLDFTGIEEHDHEEIILDMMEAFDQPYHGIQFAIRTRAITKRRTACPGASIRRTRMIGIRVAAKSSCRSDAAKHRRCRRRGG